MIDTLQISVISVFRFIQLLDPAQRDAGSAFVEARESAVARGIAA